jgi:O-antigen biosynthesis protein
MALCDAVFVTTEPLAQYARRIHPRVFVVPNTVNEEMVRLADAALANRESRTGAVTIAYFSGTATHDRDFVQAAGAVLAALEGNPAVRFLVVGNLRLDERFDDFRDRITELPIQPWQRLSALMANVHINLAPLEPDNEFTESKSCLKYLEAALLGVPTVASPRHDFRRVIADGVNGLLAETPDEWREAISSLVESPDRRSSIGQAAFDDVRANHTTSANAQRLYNIFADLAAEKRSSTRPLAINFLSGSRGKGVGSGRKLADELALRGHRVEFTIGVNDFPHTDVLIALGADAAENAAATNNALFQLCVVSSSGEEERVSRLPFRVVQGP